MAFIGNTANNQAFTPAIDYFNGTGSAVAFTLSRPVASVASIIVTVDNVIQNPYSAYTVSSNTLTFTSAPLSGTNNIWVEYTSLITQTIAPSQGTVGLSQLSATGTPSSSTYLRGDNSWASIAASQWTTTGSDIYYNTGNVGIGTSSPTEKLQVAGNIILNNGNADGAQLTLASSGYSNWNIDNYSGSLRAYYNVTEYFKIDTSGNLQFNSGFGSVGYAYGVRAWIYVSTPSSATIGGSGNVSSLTRTAAGQYVINFTNAMPDANYAILLGYQNSAWGQFIITNVPKTTTSCTIGAGTTGTNQDPTSFCVAIVR